MEFGFTLNRNENDITAGIGTEIIKLITKAIESNSIESFYKIDGFCYRFYDIIDNNSYIISRNI